MNQYTNADELDFYHNRVLRTASTLKEAQSENLLCIAEGDMGGQSYFAIPAQYISCSLDDLVRLTFEIDFIHWEDPAGVNVYFSSVPIGEPCGGGMGGAESTGSLWLHDEIAGSVLSQRIASVLSGDRRSLWPSGGDFGRPTNPSDIIDLLDEETGEGPVFKTIRTAIEIQKQCGIDTQRLFAVLPKFLGSSDARNRIEAAQHLRDKADIKSLVDAVYESAAGNISFPKWGMWRELAIYTLARLAKDRGSVARESLERLAASDDWIASSGPYVFSRFMSNDEERVLFQPAAFREAYAGEFAG